jgi:CheY-like chemotaxis protein
MPPTKKTILIIEDDAVQLGVLGEKIANEGLTVLEAKDGIQGLEIARSEQPDIILLDNRMPNMSGYQMLRKLRDSETAWGQNVPVIFFSNIEPSSKDERADLEAVQPTAYLLKSDTDLSGIVAKIKETLGA